MNKLNFVKKPDSASSPKIEARDSKQVDLSTLVINNVVEVIDEDNKKYILTHKGELNFPEEKIKGALIRFAIKGEGNFFGIIKEDSIKTLKVGEPISVTITRCIPSRNGFDLRLKDDGTPEEKIFNTLPVKSLILNLLKGLPTDADKAESFVKGRVDDVMEN